MTDTTQTTIFGWPWPFTATDPGEADFFDWQPRVPHDTQYTIYQLAMASRFEVVFPREDLDILFSILTVHPDRLRVMKEPFGHFLGEADSRGARILPPFNAAAMTVAHVPLPAGRPASQNIIAYDCFRAFSAINAGAELLNRLYIERESL